MADKTKGLSIGYQRERAILIYCNEIEGDREEAIFDLFNALCIAQPYAKYMRDSDLTAQEMYCIAERLRQYGWAQATYLPIASFCMVNPLRYLLSHKQELLGNKGLDAFNDAHIRLKRFFVTPLG